MLDLKFIRENSELVKKGVENKQANIDIDEILQLDEERRSLIKQTEELKSKRNKVSKEVGRLKKAGENADEVIAEMRQVGDEIKELDTRLNEIRDKINELLIWVPNLPHESTPVGKSEEDNIEVRQWLPEGFSFEQEEKPMDHLKIGKKLKILDFERGAKVTGSGFPLYIGKGASLERALINYMLDYHLQKHNYTEVFPPFFVNRDSMFGTGQLPKLEDDMYLATKDDLFTIPTAEVPITNMHRDETLNEEQLPVNYV